jgi:hypothetical protein
MYLLFRLLTKYPQDAFIYRHGDKSAGFVIHYKGKTWSHHSIHTAFTSALMVKILTGGLSRPIWAMLDGAAAIPTGTHEIRQIVLVSPGLQTNPAIKGLLKPSGTVAIVNPPWEFAELESLRKHAYSKRIDTAGLLTSFREWGGIPRIVFDLAIDPEKREKLESSLRVAKPDALFRQAGLAAIDHDIVSSIHFHLIPGQIIPETTPDDDDTIGFRYAAYSWATNHIQDQIWKEMTNRGGERSIMKFLLDLDNGGVPRGLAFEPHVFHTLENVGLYGQTKYLHAKGSVGLRPQELPRTGRIYFSSFDEINKPIMGIKPQAGKYYVPSQKNHASVDLYIPDHGIMLQITVGETHGVRWEGVDKAIKSGVFDEWQRNNPLPNPQANPPKKQPIRMVFLCDHFNYPAFTRQPWLGAKGKKYKDAKNIAECDELVEQYAWELDVQTQLGLHERVKGLKQLYDLEKRDAGKWGLNDLDLSTLPPRAPTRTRMTGDQSIVQNAAANIVTGTRPAKRQKQ